MESYTLMVTVTIGSVIIGLIFTWFQKADHFTNHDWATNHDWVKVEADQRFAASASDRGSISGAARVYAPSE